MGRQQHPGYNAEGWTILAARHLETGQGLVAVWEAVTCLVEAVRRLTEQPPALWIPLRGSDHEGRLRADQVIRYIVAEQPMGRLVDGQVVKLTLDEQLAITGQTERDKRAGRVVEGRSAEVPKDLVYAVSFFTAGRDRWASMLSTSEIAAFKVAVGDQP